MMVVKRCERAERVSLASGAGHGAPASEPVGESEGRSPSDEIEEKYWRGESLEDV
jgi:hypothetical protein